jgi:hypothetical protein
MVLSYAAISAVDVGPVSDWRNPPFGAPRVLESLLRITPVDGAIRTKGYNSGATRKYHVFNIIDPDRTPLAADRLLVENTDHSAVLRARSIISEQRGRVDAFGRLDRGRAAWLLTRVRGKPVAWGAIFDQAASNALRNRVPAYSFHSLDSNQVNWDLMQYGITPAENLSRSRRELDRLLVIELESIQARSVSGSGLVEVSYKMLADFFDLRPAKPGNHFWETYTVTHSGPEWEAGAETMIRADLAEASWRIAGKIRTRL